MADSFVALAASLRDRVAAPEVVPVPLDAPAEPSSATLVEMPDRCGEAAAVIPTRESPQALVGELTLMRLAAREAFERRARRLIADLARDVLARELALVPADIEALIGSALVAFADYEPVALSIAAADAGTIRSDLPIRIDAQLERGDLTVHVRDGAFESPFAFRLASTLEEGLA
ncbi:MAG: hypothetical protein NVS2B3_02610 [Vulcanimicrobiaceae bacterium]